ncbi:isochorismatase family cysteine hydrolase [Halobacillus yeomjeoni]|uniref:Cysteine hydrolase n=1 Tax=Halobacillus yeomjeoni TaxID=311194 RepID=A0A931MW85_9BACI|nr:isochorismatase family cysteine hydrolase [Halobacillus yeomjeoni]MBH0231179.1 cysteine hydrolase [Halobacillus yeomjeoni]
MNNKTALIITDMVNKMDFDGGDDLLRHSLSMVDNLISLKKKVKEKGVPVIYVNDNFGLWQDNASELIKECKKGRGEPVVDAVMPEEDDYFIIKPKHSGFYGTQLDILLKHLKVENLILTGVAGDICVLFTANDAYMREYNLWVPKDCVASEKIEDNDNALQIIQRSLFANTRESTNTSIDETFLS